jgi:hypothetical protein
VYRNQNIWPVASHRNAFVSPRMARRTAPISLAVLAVPSSATHENVKRA